MTRKRALLAGLLGLVYPGLGHIYIREWIWAVIWFIVAVVTAVFVMPQTLVEAIEADGYTALLDMGDHLTVEAWAALSSIRLLNAIDAALLALRPETVEEEEPTHTACPECGGDLDEDLSFCPWCTTELERPTASETDT